MNFKNTPVQKKFYFLRENQKIGSLSVSELKLFSFFNYFIVKIKIRNNVD